jgi:putative addiction module component (TIGR02574 family)
VTDEEIVAAALNLPAKTRDELVSRLIESLEEVEEGLSPEQWEQSWAQEAERRDREMDEDKAKGVPGEDVMRELRDLVG